MFHEIVEDSWGGGGIENALKLGVHLHQETDNLKIVKKNVTEKRS